MIKKRGNFLTFVFSLLPGAGHMYMGFMKTGVSLMALFFFIIFLSTWLNTAPLLFILPVLWFFSFFDSLNRHSASNEEFALLEDRYLFSIDKLLSLGIGLSYKKHFIIGLILVLFGAYILCNNILNSIYPFIPNEIHSFISSAMRMFPQILIGILIIVIGLRLIIAKKRSDENDA